MNRPDPDGKPVRLVSLDALRAVAVLLVIGRHMDAPSVDSPLVHGVLTNLSRGGWIGVDLFFVLSGFLISGLLFRELQEKGRIQVGRFLIRRGLKLYPAFYVFIACTLLVRGAAFDRIPPTSDLLGELVYLQNYLGGIWAHTWSLAVEEHFYLLLAGLLLALAHEGERSGRPSFGRIPVIAGTLFVLCLGVRLLMEYDGSGVRSYHTRLFPTHLRVDSLMFGVLLSYWYHFRRDALDEVMTKIGPVALSVVGVLMLAPAFAFPLFAGRFMHTFGLTLNYLGSGAILMSALTWEKHRPRTPGVLAYVGYHSYSIYLWHLAVKEWGLPILGLYTGLSRGTLTTFVVFAMASCVVGIMMAKVVEMPVLRVRDRLLPSRSGALVVADRPGAIVT